MTPYVNLEEILRDVKKPENRPIYQEILSLRVGASCKVRTTARYLKQVEGGRSGIEGFRRSVSRFVNKAVQKFPELYGRQYIFHCSVYDPKFLKVRRVA